MVGKYGGTIITIRCDLAEDKHYDYKVQIDQLVVVARGEIKQIFKKKTDYLAATSADDPTKYYFLFGFIKM